MSVDELVGASQQFEVSSLYGDDAEQQQSAMTSSKRFAESLSAENLRVVQHSRFHQNTTVSGATWHSMIR